MLHLAGKGCLKAGKAAGGRSPLTVAVLLSLSCQAVMDLDVELRMPYDSKDMSLPDSCMVLRIPVLPTAVGMASLNEFRGISLIRAMAKFYTAAMTRLLQSKLGSCALEEYHRPSLFVYGARAAAEQLGVGLGVLFDISCEWQIGEALYVLSGDARAAFGASMPDSVLQALREFGISARTRRPLAEVLFSDRAMARMEVETEEFAYLPTHQGGVESTAQWHVFLRNLLRDLDRQWEEVACGISSGVLGVVRCLVWGDNLYLLVRSASAAREIVDVAVRELARHGKKLKSDELCVLRSDTENACGAGRVLLPPRGRNVGHAGGGSTCTFSVWCCRGTRLGMCGRDFGEGRIWVSR